MPVKEHPAPQISADEAEIIVGKLRRAQIMHRVWLKPFQAMLVCRSRPAPIYLKKNSHLKTPFGRWHSNETNKFIVGHPLFAEIGKHNQKMNRNARKLAKACGRGNPITLAQYSVFVESVDRLKLSLRKLVKEVEEFRLYIDPLTGAANRFIMTQRLEHERQRVKRTGQPCSIGMMDLDKFKGINDLHGHRGGDQVLREVAAYLLVRLRRYDQFFRYGGEEFVIMLPNTTPSQAKMVLDRIRRGLRRQKINIHDGTGISVSASFGVAPLEPNHLAKFAINNADKAMYEAKKAGRNRTHIWTDQVPDKA